MTQTDPLHTVIGEVSAIVYFVCSIMALLTFIIYAVFPIQMIATIHLMFILVCLFSVSGLVIWWIVEYVISTGDSDAN